MNPKDKAKDLIEKLKLNLWDTDNAIECALIAVDELIEEVLDLDRLKYWNEVKQELNKM